MSRTEEVLDSIKSCRDTPTSKEVISTMMLCEIAISIARICDVLEDKKQ